MSRERRVRTTDVPALKRARENYQMAFAYDPTSVGWQGLHLGRLLHLSGHYEAASDALRASAESGDVDYAPVAAFHLGKLLEELGDTEQAAAAYRQAVESGHPKNAAAAAYRLGGLLHTAGDVEAARAAFEQAAASNNNWYGRLGSDALLTLT